MAYRLRFADLRLIRRSGVRPTLWAHNFLGHALSPAQGRGTWAFGHAAEIQVAVQGGQRVIQQTHFIVGDALWSTHFLPRWRRRHPRDDLAH